MVRLLQSQVLLRNDPSLLEPKGDNYTHRKHDALKNSAQALYAKLLAG